MTDSVTGQTNQNGGFIASNGNPVPPAGIFYNGANLDKGPSSLAVNHAFLAHGIVDLPWKFNFSSIFRAQSGFHYSAGFFNQSIDVDGDNQFNGVDFFQACNKPGWVGGCRNHFTAGPNVNLDVRIAKRFDIGERLKVNLYFEMFNIFNRANPAAVQSSVNQSTPFGTPLQVLPGREGQVGIRIAF